MKIKWSEDYSAKTQRLWGVVIGFFAGAILTTGALGVLWEWGVLKGAKWWEVVTAFATLAAVITALAFSTRDSWARYYERSRLKSIYGSIFKTELLGLYGAIRYFESVCFYYSQHGYGDFVPDARFESFEGYRNLLKVTNISENIDKFIFFSENEAKLLSDVASLSSLLYIRVSGLESIQYLDDKFFDQMEEFPKVLKKAKMLVKSCLKMYSDTDWINDFQ